MQSNNDPSNGGNRSLNTPNVSIRLENISSDIAGQISQENTSNDSKNFDYLKIESPLVFDPPFSFDYNTDEIITAPINETFQPFIFNPIDECNDSQFNVENSEGETLMQIETNAENADINAINEAEQIAVEVPMDSNSIKILPNGIKIVNGVAQMPFDRSELNDGDQSTFEPRFTNQLQFLKTIISRDFFRNRLALPFLHPVNGLENPSYYDIIMEPMDFTTIEKRLNFLWYRSAAECIDDIRQIFINCFCFNPPSHHVYSSGQKLQENVEMKLAKMPADEEEIDCPPKPSLEKYMKKPKKISLNTDPSTSSFDPQGSKRASQMITRSKSGIKIRKPNKDFPVPLTVAVKKVPLNQPLKECLDFVKELFKIPCGIYLAILETSQ